MIHQFNQTNSSKNEQAAKKDAVESTEKAGNPKEMGGCASGGIRSIMDAEGNVPIDRRRETTVETRWHLNEAKRYLNSWTQSSIWLHIASLTFPTNLQPLILSDQRRSAHSDHCTDGSRSSPAYQAVSKAFETDQTNSRSKQSDRRSEQTNSRSEQPDQRSAQRAWQQDRWSEQGAWWSRQQDR